LMKIKPNKLEDAYRMHNAKMAIEHICEVTGLSENIITKYIKKRKRKRRLPIRKKTI